MDDEEFPDHATFLRLLSEAGEGIGPDSAWDDIYRAATSMSFTRPAGALKNAKVLRIVLSSARSDSSVPGRLLWTDGTHTDGAEATLCHAASKLGFVEDKSAAGNERVLGAFETRTELPRAKKSRRTRPQSTSPSQHPVKAPVSTTLGAGKRYISDADQPTFTHMEGLQPDSTDQDGSIRLPIASEKAEGPPLGSVEAGGPDGGLAAVTLASQLRQLIEDATRMHADAAKEMRAQEARHTELVMAQQAQLARIEEQLRRQAASGETNHASIVSFLQKEVEAMKQGQAMVLEALTAVPNAARPSLGHSSAPPPAGTSAAPAGTAAEQVGTLEEDIVRLQAQLHASIGAAPPGNNDLLSTISERVTVMMAAVAELGQQYAATSNAQAAYMAVLVLDLQQRLATTIGQLAGIIQAFVNATGRSLTDHGERLVRLEEGPPVAPPSWELEPSWEPDFPGAGSLTGPGDPSPT